MKFASKTTDVQRELINGWSYSDDIQEGTTKSDYCELRSIC